MLHRLCSRLRLALLVSGCPAIAAASEAGRPFLQLHPPQEYRGHHKVWSVLPEPGGLIRFGVQGHAIAFDGTRWEYTPVPGAAYVSAMITGPDGRVFLGGIDEIGFLAPRPRGGTEFISLTPALPAAWRPLGPVGPIATFGDSVFFATQRGLLVWRDGAFTRLEVVTSAHSRLVADGATLWLAQPESGLHAVAGAQAGTTIATARFALATAMPEGGVFLLAADGRAWVHREGQVEAIAQALPHLTGLQLNDALVSARGFIAVATDRGVLLFARDGSFLQQIDDTKGLEPRVFALGEDREGGVWAGTDHGLSRLEPGTAFTLFFRRDGIERGVIDSFCRHEGRLYATQQGRLFRLSAASAQTGGTARWVRVENSVAGARALASHASGLLVGAADGVYLKSDDESPGPWQRVATMPDGVHRIALARTDANLAFIGRGAGLAVMQFDSNAWHLVTDQPGPAGEVPSLEQGRDGSVWSGSPTRGFTRWRQDPAAGWSAATATVLHADAGLPAHAGPYRVLSLGDDLLFSTRSGLFHFDAALQRFVPDDRWMIDGNPVLSVDQVEPGAAGEFWTGAGRGRPGGGPLQALGRFHPGPDGRLQWSELPAGILESIGYDGATTMHWERVAGNEVLWVSGSDGLLRIDTRRMPRAPADWAPVIVRAGRSHDGDRIHVAADGRAVLTFSREPLTIAFAVLRFANGSEFEFQTRLLGYDDAWTPFSKRTEATFTNLHGGPFTFEVRARDNSGAVSAPARLTFSISPPLHRSPGAWLLYAVLAGAAVVGFVRWRTAAVRREQRRLEQIVAERTAEMKIARDAADEANRAKSTFLAHMSHELRTPLNGVIGYAQVLQKDRTITAASRERLQIVQTSGEHLLRMINEVLDFSKIEAGRLELTTAPFHLPQFLRDIAAAMSSRFEQKELEFALHLAPGLPEQVLGDALKLRQVIDNLLGNALKFTAAGSVTLAARAAGAGEVEVSVGDTGVGISAADLARLFQPFQQALDGRPPEPGTGLGLAISARLVHLMGGALAAESEPGRGSRFTFTVPLPALTTGSTPRQPTANIITGYHRRRRRVLLVDDVATNRHVLRDLLAPLGFAVTEAANGSEALALTPALRPDVVFLDLRLPGIDGLELARRLRTRDDGGRTRLIAMSASVLVFNREQALAAGCDDFLPKPFREDDLLARLGLVLQLEWIGGAGIVPPATPADASGTALSDETRQELLTMARRGEISALRQRLETVAGDPLADTLIALARTYSMEQIRTLLDPSHPTTTRSVG